MPGELVRNLDGHYAFIPGPLPPKLLWDEPTVNALSAADHALGRLAGVATGDFGGINPDLLIRPFSQREAVLSSRIEGTRANISDLVLFEESDETEKSAPDVREVHNYLRTLEFGLDSLRHRALSLSLLREMHRLLMQTVRGGDSTPGAFRTIQVFLGKSQHIDDARYVPPPPLEVPSAMQSLEQFIQSPPPIPPLVRLALLHYQFEAIHPFQDGNGRIGRLLMTLLLCREKLLPLPMLYLSAYFEKHRQSYYDKLLAISLRGAWNDWIVFFLQGVATESTDAVSRAAHLMQIRAKYYSRVQSARSSALLPKLIDQLFLNPAITTKRAGQALRITPASAQSLIDKLIKAKILREVTGRKRNRIYVAHGIVHAMDDPLPPEHP
ncbi:MAG TPA: Fic family protein [Phycisphaerae bacterium]|nr:Fic family protein [Phycisphaerae bacterium]